MAGWQNSSTAAGRVRPDRPWVPPLSRPYLQCKGLRALESGAGTGVVGLTCAVMGATVVLAEADTDARRVVAANLEKARGVGSSAIGQRS